jgi:murein DD-endopeptidase MepM/ murein hydrolase activator NlpD
LCVFCDSGDSIKVDGRPDGELILRARADEHAPEVARIDDNGRVRIVDSQPTDWGQDGWRKVSVTSRSDDGGIDEVTGWVKNVKLLDNCDGPAWTFACLPLGGWTPQAGGDQLFGPTQWAHDNWVGNYDGTRGLHGGLDFSAPNGTNQPLVWPGTGNGTVSNIEPYNRDGAPNIVIQYGFEYVVFSHRAASYVENNPEVRPGQTIGLSGASGNGYSHLHFGVTTNDYVHHNPLYDFSPELQARILSHAQGYVQEEAHGGPFNAYSMVYFDANATMPAGRSRIFWEDNCSWIGIAIRVWPSPITIYY